MFFRALFSICVPILFNSLVAGAGTLSGTEARLRSEVIALAAFDKDLPKLLEEAGIRYLARTQSFGAIQCELDLLSSFELKLDKLVEKTQALEPRAENLLRLLVENANDQILKTGGSSSPRMKVRQHQGGLDEAMATTVEIDRSMEALIDFLSVKMERPITAEDIEVKPYGKIIDIRNGWNTHMIKVDGIPYGFSDGPVH